MSSMFASHTLITGGTNIQAHGDVHYHGLRESADILHRATATAAFHNSDERFDPPKCHPNTRIAVLEKIMRWIKWGEDLDAFIMWVYGPAGAGKSAIAQTIAEMCEDEMILLASFFFSRNDPSRSTVKPLIATIAYQITLNLPQVRDAILAAIEHDPLIFSKSLAVQVKSLIVAPLQPLAEAGYFNEPISRRLVIIDGLDECSDPRVQQNILEVLANAQRQYGLPLIFLFASRPEQHISLTFNTGLLPGDTTRIALDESYLPDGDIELFLTDKFQEIKSTHRLRAYIPPQWPLPDVLEHLVRKSSGQFVYASTVIRYVASIRHKPVDRLDIILGIRPPQRDLPFAELDALYTHILSGAEDIEHVLEILGVIFFCDHSGSRKWNLRPQMIEKVLGLQPGDVELYLGDLNSLVYIEPGRCSQYIRVLHATLTDFFVDPTRSKIFWINRQALHTAFARQCLQACQIPGDGTILWIAHDDIFYHLENAEMTPELCDDLINFSFNNLSDVAKHSSHPNSYDVHHFAPFFLGCLKKLPSSEANNISQTLQVDFDRILCNILEKYHSFPGFALLLGSLFPSIEDIKKLTFPPGMVTYLYLVRQQGEGYLLDDIKFSGIVQVGGCVNGTQEFLVYLTQLLENPERAGTHVFDQQRYTTAAKECLQLCLCNYRDFSKRATESGHHDRALRRSKPSAWIARMGVRSKIRKSRHQLQVLLKASSRYISQEASFPENSPEHEFYRSMSYQWALDLLPFFLEHSAISLELAEVLRRRNFTTMAQNFPRRTRLAKEAIASYLLRVESAVGGS